MVEAELNISTRLLLGQIKKKNNSGGKCDAEFAALTVFWENKTQY